VSLVVVVVVALVQRLVVVVVENLVDVAAVVEWRDESKILVGYSSRRR